MSNFIYSNLTKYNSIKKCNSREYINNTYK